MLNHPPYRHDIIKKAVAAFGAIFTGLKVERVDNEGVVQQVIEVPVSMGSKEKWLARLQETPDVNQKSAITLPRIGFELVGFNYDSARKIQHMRPVLADNTTTSKLGTATGVYAPVPYTLTFMVYIAAKTYDDGLGILEQILPFFTPSYTVTLNVVPDVGIVQDCLINIADVSLEDTYEGMFDQRREIYFTLTFTMGVSIFGPVEKQSTILKTQMLLDPMYGTVNRKLVSAAVANPDGTWTITDTAGDVPR